MASLFRSISSYFGFLTSAPPAQVSSSDADGNIVTSTVTSPTSYVSPDVVEQYTLIGYITLGSNAAGGNAATAPASFSDFPLANIDFNPPLSAFTISKIRSVSIRAPPLPHDVNWYAAVWATTAAAGRTYDAIRRRAPNVAWTWRSNVTVIQPTEHAVPWPLGLPVSDSLHATLPGLHTASLQIGCHNNPAGTASALPAGAYQFDVIVVVDVAGRGLFGHL